MRDFIPKSTQLTERDRKNIDGYFNAVQNLKAKGYRLKTKKRLFYTERTKKRCLHCQGTLTGLHYGRKYCDKTECYLFARNRSSKIVPVTRIMTDEEWWASPEYQKMKKLGDQTHA